MTDIALDVAVATPNGRRRGTVIEWDEKRGYGIIQADGVDANIFVHHSSVFALANRRRMQEGLRVEFKVTMGHSHGRVEASNVTGIDGQEVNRELTPLFPELEEETVRNRYPTGQSTESLLRSILARLEPGQPIQYQEMLFDGNRVE